MQTMTIEITKIMDQPSVNATAFDFSSGQFTLADLMSAVSHLGWVEVTVTDDEGNSQTVGFPPEQFAKHLA